MNAAGTADHVAAEPSWVGEVLQFWFHEVGAARWFAKDHDVDARIRERFLSLHERLAADAATRHDTQRSLLAAIIVLDQFSRNLFRADPRAYAADPIARQLADVVIDNGLDRELSDAERMFVYLPFEHSEDREDQALSVALFGQLGNADWMHYAEAHKAIIDRFGRFPHRNAILNRHSTAEEIALLSEPKGSF
jgi:uncharacterized protein (DUF924 family)